MAQAPVKTESRIDVPKPLAQVKAGRVTVAGTAIKTLEGATVKPADMGGTQTANATIYIIDTVLMPPSS